MASIVQRQSEQELKTFRFKQEAQPQPVMRPAVFTYVCDADSTPMTKPPATNSLGTWHPCPRCHGRKVRRIK